MVSNGWMAEFPQLSAAVQRRSRFVDKSSNQFHLPLLLITVCQAAQPSYSSRAFQQSRFAFSGFCFDREASSQLDAVQSQNLDCL